MTNSDSLNRTQLQIPFYKIQAVAAFLKIVKSLQISSGQRIDMKLECGPMPNLMVALPNIGGALCSTPQSLADAHY